MCITQTCGENEQVVSVGFDSSLDPTSSNSNCEACAAGFASTAGVNRTCEDIDECSTDPCQNGAVCSTPNVNSYECACVAGYEGDDCETDINECSPDPCENGATCSTPECQFLPLRVCGWLRGHDCETDINECSPDPCQNSATCTQTTDGVNLAVNSYHCECVAGYEGTNCETDINECSPESLSERCQLHGRLPMVLL